MYVIIAILLIMCFCVVFFRMYTTIKHYHTLNEKLKAENEDLKQHQGFKHCKIEIPPQYITTHPFETYKTSLEISLYDFIKTFNREIDTAMKERLTIMLAENLVKDEKISFSVEENMLYDTALITATIRIVHY